MYDVFLYIHKWDTNHVYMNKSSLEENCILKFLQSILPPMETHLLRPMSLSSHYVQEIYSLLRTDGYLTFSQFKIISRVVMFCANLSNFWAVWIFLAGKFTEEDVDFHWSVVELSHMCRHSLRGLSDLKGSDFRGMLESIQHFIGIILRLVFLTRHHVHTLVIHLKCTLLCVNETNHIFAASTV